MNNSNRIDTILFDFDGTIMDTNDIVYASMQHTFITLTGEKGDEQTIFDTFGEPLGDVLMKLFPEFDVEESLAIYRGYQFKHYEEMIELFPGVEEMIAWMHEKGYKLGLVTNRLRNSTVIGMKKYGLDEIFGSIVACDEAEKNKPYAEPVLLALEQLNSIPEKAIFVGDSANDILSGKNANVKTVRVAWALASDGSHDESDVTPDYVIDTPEELIDLLKNQM